MDQIVVDFAMVKTGSYVVVMKKGTGDSDYLSHRCLRKS